MLLVVDDAELTGSNALNEIIRKDRVAAFGRLLQTGMMELWRMADLEGNFRGQFGWREMMEIMEFKLISPCFLRFVALGYIEHIISHVLLDDIPRTTAEA